MDIFGGLGQAFLFIPDWVSFLVIPALLTGAAVLSFLWKKRSVFALAAVFLCGLGAAFLGARGARAVCIFVGLLAVYVCLLIAAGLLVRRRPQGEAPKRGKRADDRPLVTVAGPSEEAYSDQNVKLKHAGDLLARLRKAPLAAGDRIEEEILSRTISALGAKPLTEEEFVRLNECLAALLKLTAKYKL